MSGNLCQRLGCGDTQTEPAHISLPGGRAYKVYLCKKHKKDLECFGEVKKTVKEEKEVG